ncbi:hypothetical protein [Bifidobacterium platyrrhinorum]|uniref:Uncharacterized protein n=1 Tax=Bifidobacterium platyrrhinorum TaxID=2661628 RepID=A0A6L9SYC9_9BIFI|nr:hypothetical protein [Bifidobacterium platyrrhinorum]NEG56131.1 hypothetical protein [Bifidobacterium platyrrhinorum]
MSKTTEYQPSIEDFDSWDETQDEKAIKAVAGHLTVRHIIKNDEYWALAPSKRIYKLPLLLSLNDFKRLTNADTDAESIDAVSGILAAFAGQKQADQLADEPVQVVMNILADYGETITRTQGVDLGKSDGSAK